MLHVVSTGLLLVLLPAYALLAIAAWWKLVNDWWHGLRIFVG